jgi:hypothetical protein
MRINGHPESKIHLDAAPFIRMLNSLIWGRIAGVEENYSRDWKSALQGFLSE